MKNFRLILTALALLVTLLVILVTGCQSKKKAISIQKSATAQQSEVQKENNENVVDKSAYMLTNSDNSKHITLLEWYNPDTAKGSVKYRKIIIRANDIQTKQVGKLDINKTVSSKTDSTGQSKTVTKSKVQDKEVKDNLTSKAFGIGFLVIVGVLTVVYIRYQTNR